MDHWCFLFAVSLKRLLTNKNRIASDLGCHVAHVTSLWCVYRNLYEPSVKKSFVFRKLIKAWWCIYVNELCTVMTCHLLDQRHNLTQCSLPQSNLNQNKNVSFMKMYLKICKMAAILVRPQIKARFMTQCDRFTTGRLSYLNSNTIGSNDNQKELLATL